MLRRISIVLAVSLCAACGGPGSVDGSVAGNSFAIQDSVSRTIPDPSTGQIIGALIVLSTTPNVCQDMKDGVAHPDAGRIAIALTRLADNGTVLPIVTGDYQVTDSPTEAGLWATGAVEQNDPECHSTIPDDQVNLVSGKVTLTKVGLTAGGTTEGTFSLSVGKQNDKITGSFSAVFCDGQTKDGELSCT